MEKRSIIVSLIVVTISIAIFIGFIILKNSDSRHLSPNGSKTDINMDQPTLGDDDFEKEKSDSEEFNSSDDNEDIISKPVKEQEKQSNSILTKNTTVKTNINTNSNKVSSSNESTSINKNTNNKTNSNISSSNVTSSDSNKTSTTNDTTNKQDEWNTFISSSDTLKILGGHLDFYNESDAKAKQKELKSLGYVVNLKYACLEEKCVYSVIAQTGNGLCNANNTEYDWRKLNKMGVIDFLHYLENDCSGYTDPFSGKSY